METFCTCCSVLCAQTSSFAQSDSVGLYSPVIFTLSLRNSESGTIALSRERWKWKWIEFPEIQRMFFFPAQAMYKCIYFNCKKLQLRQQQTCEIPKIPNCCLHFSAEYIIYIIQTFIMFNVHNLYVTYVLKH